MSIENGKEEPRSSYYQLILQGWGDVLQQANQNSSTSPDADQADVPPEKFWQQKRHIILIPVIIEPFDLHDTEHTFAIQIPTNLDISISPLVRNSKKLSRQVINLPATKKRDTVKIPMVYGVSDKGDSTLSPVVEHNAPRDISYVVGRILGEVARAIGCKIQFTQATQEATDNPTERTESSPTPQDLGKHKKARRSKKIRDKILPETLAEETSEVVD